MIQIRPSSVPGIAEVHNTETAEHTLLDAEDWAYRTLTDEGLIRVADLTDEDFPNFVFIPIAHRFIIEDIINVKA